VSAPVSIGIKTSPQAVDWPTLDAAWARIGEHAVFESVWLNDHLTDIGQERAGPSWEALTLLAALIHRVPGKWVGHAVLSVTFRHPSVLAKAATVMDHATGGRFILGLGAGWFDPEHTPFGIPYPPMPERFDRFESAVHTIRAMGSPAATTDAGVTRDDPFYPLDGATNDPPMNVFAWYGKRAIRLLASTYILYFSDSYSSFNCFCVLLKVSRICSYSRFMASLSAWEILAPFFCHSAILF
jgi:alkanesulfonate monooxygenase SsuD/methylene tetrahydromethanopterin reductase-like flavin-dependent oxidoreductase (luciferase family)